MSTLWFLGDSRVTLSEIGLNMLFALLDSRLGSIYVCLQLVVKGKVRAAHSAYSLSELPN
jgi:hypothetical protein